MKIPAWPPRDIRAAFALAASVAGAGVLTAFAAWIVWILWKGGWPVDTASDRIAALAKALLGTLFTVAIVLMSLGLAINKRSVKGSILGASFEADGGDAEAPQTAVTTTTTTAITPPAQEAQP